MLNIFARWGIISVSTQIFVAFEKVNNVKKFWERHSYDVVKLILDQFAIAMFGIALAISIGKAQNETLQVFASIAAVIFYLFLLYTVMWRAGSHDLVRVEGGRLAADNLTGLYVALFAQIPNFILAVLITLGEFFSFNPVFGQIGAVSGVIALFWEGMYTGLLTIHVGGAPLNSYWFMYFVIMIPALAVSTLAYYFGLKNYHATNLLIAETPEDTERKKEEKEKKKHKDQEQ